MNGKYGLLILIATFSSFATCQDVRLPFPECKETKLGREYRGFTNVTSSGLSCQEWESNYPHAHGNKKAKVPDAGLDRNYCRNPDSESQGPWCYTRSSRRWEFCSLPLCSKVWKCVRKMDIVLLFEIPHGDSNSILHVKSIFKSLERRLRPSLDCVRLEVILVWKHVDIITGLNCAYGISQCYETALKGIQDLQEEIKRWYAQDKNSLIEGIEIAQRHLFGKEHGARTNVEKVMIVVLSSPPVKSVMPIEDAVKDLQDMRVNIMAVGIGGGRKEKLSKIALDPVNIYQVDKFADLSKQYTLEKIASRLTTPINRQGRNSFEPQNLLGKLPIGSPLGLSEAHSVAVLAADQQESCKYLVDIGFLIDSSGSMQNDYEKEKLFVQRIAARFGISELASRAGVVVFSSAGYVETAIKFSQCSNFKEFKVAVDKLPFHGYLTRIDLALKSAANELFTKEAGSRENVSRVVFLVTDGRQNPDDENGVLLNPAAEAAKLRAKGIKVIVTGIGKKVNETELRLIAGSSDNVYAVNNFDELIKDEFVKILSTKVCKGALILPPKEKPGTKSDAAEGCKEENKCADGCCGCNQKPPVYINKFHGNKSKSRLLHDLKIKQLGKSNSIESVGFDFIGPRESNRKINSKKIIDILKKLLPSKGDDIFKSVQIEEAIQQVN